MYKECDSSVGDNSEGGASGGGESRGDDGAAEKEQPKPETAAVQSEKTPHRKRKKHFFTRIRTQMEFYFGDANLSKDRFLNKLLAENEYVPLDTFLKFNKIKEFTTAIEDIQKAVESSEILELSPDKQSVRRTTVVQKKPDIDEYMIYVEGFRPNATHDSIKSQFKQFGNVVYVSLPKFRSGRIKEFAFVEFDDKESVERCVTAYRHLNSVIGQTFEAEKLKSIESYIKEQDDAEGGEAKEKPVELAGGDAVPEVKSAMKHKSGDEQSQKEGEPVAGSSDGEPAAAGPPQKRVKFNSEEQPEEKGASDGDDENKASDKNPNAENSESAAAKKRRRRKGKHAEERDGEQRAEHVPDNEPVDPKIVLRIATKVEWKRLRNKYLAIQRERYSEAKKLLLQQRKSGAVAKKSTLPPLVRPVTMKTKQVSASPHVAKRICTRNINFYGAMREEQSASTYECGIVDDSKPKAKSDDEKPPEKPADKKPAQFAYEPGLIVRVNFDEPCVDVADFKAEMKQHACVRYVDLKEGQAFAMVRVDAARSAPVLIKHCAPNRCQILAGDLEKDYWAKIADDREQKLSKAVKVPRSRDRKIKKVLRNTFEIDVVRADNKTASTHIRFDE